MKTSFQQEKKSPWQKGIEQALSLGIISTSPQPTEENLSWSTLALTFTGAFISSVLFFVAIVLFFLFIDVEEENAFYVVSILLITSSVAFLRFKRNAPLFLEMMMLIFLIVGLALLTAVMAFDLDWHIGAVSLFMSMLTALCACIVPIGWMRALGSFAAGIFFHVFTEHATGNGFLGNVLYLFSIPLLAIILLFIGLHCEKTSRWKLLGFLEPLINGWLCMTLLLLAYMSGKAMFMAQFMPFSHDSIWGHIGSSSSWEHLKNPFAWVQILSLPLTFLWARTQDVFFKQAKVLFLLIVLTLFTLIEPLLALCLTFTLLVYLTHRYKIAVLGGLCALWIVGSMYYALQITLIEKSVCFALTGLVLIFIALYKKKSKQESAVLAFESALQKDRGFAERRVVNIILIGLAGLLALGGVNASIWKQEALRREGTQVFIRLAPVDPCSLMQGDYMALNFFVPPEIRASKDGNAYLLIDEQGVGKFIDNPLEGEIPFKLEGRKGSWSVPANAWFFEEGDAKRWEAARYGVFKVDGAGRSSLIHMADERLNIINMPSSEQ